jgi:hypothetical protein
MDFCSYPPADLIEICEEVTGRKDIYLIEICEEVTGRKVIWTRIRQITRIKGVFLCGKKSGDLRRFLLTKRVRVW